MGFVKRLNAIRRRIMRRITGPLASSTYPSNGDQHAGHRVRSVLICRPNHRLGNMLLTTPLVQEIHETFPDAVIDLFVKGAVAPIIFRNYPFVRKIYSLPKKPQKDLFAYAKGWIGLRRNNYDIVINVVSNSSSGRIAARMASAKWRFMGELDAVATSYPDHQHMAKFPVYAVRSYLRYLGVKVSTAPVPPLDLKLDAGELAKGRERLSGLFNNNKKTLCIYTYATGDKCYSPDWWREFYERLQREYPSHNILEILPVENVSQIGFQATHFYSRDVREIGAVIANTTLFIGADSGMMHLAASVGIPVVGLFKFGNMDTYAPYAHGSFGINTGVSSADAIFSKIGGMLKASIGDSINA